MKTVEKMFKKNTTNCENLNGNHENEMLKTNENKKGINRYSNGYSKN